MTIYSRSHIYLGIAYKLFRVEKWKKDNSTIFSFFSDEILSVCDMEILFHGYKNELNFLYF